MVGRAGSTTDTAYADMTLTRSKVKIKVTGLLNFRKLAKPCMHAGGDDRQPPLRGFLVSRLVTHRVILVLQHTVFQTGHQELL